MQVTLDDVALGFGPRVVISGLSAKVEPLKVTALVGPSGSGKSSLLAAIAGYMRLRHGAVRFKQDEFSEETHPNPDQVVWIPQGSNSLPARSAIENIMIGALANGTRSADARSIAAELLLKVGLDGKGELRARQLSGGELQRLNFARALASGKPLVLADEPTSSLDLSNIRIVAGLLRELSGGATIVVATHDEVIVEAADAVIDLRPFA